ncbi:MAG: hypothetical protein ACE5ER_08530 [Nitrospinaceae bacterium]
MQELLVTVGTDKGLFLLWSDTDRLDWRLEGPLLKGWKIHAVLLDHRSDPVLYATAGSGIYGPGIQVSRDLGKTWRELEHPPQYPEDVPHQVNAIWCLTPGAAGEPGTLYAGVDPAGLFVSRDGGNHWEEMPGLSRHPSREEWVGGLGGLCCHSVLVDPENPSRLWVGISAVGVFRSEDGGRTWTIRNEGLEKVIESKSHPEIGVCVHRLLLDPKRPDRLFQQNHRGVFRSTDGGDTWSRIENGLPHRFGFPMVLNPLDPSHLFIVPQESDEARIIPDGQLTVYRSKNAGESWHPLRRGLPKQSFAGVLRHAMGVDGLQPCGLYFGTTGGQLLHSRDNGDQWRTFDYHLPRINTVTAYVVKR